MRFTKISVAYLSALFDQNGLSPEQDYFDRKYDQSHGINKRQ